ncbi:NADP-dependent oxidoreductase domain-containing protein [Armillaria luteobubalina]|uniref:NADP-dependent oxidoreductase domain-containing protein n=1 Tax=Armillaria luteobubalina TaxID=153913 RepID=A0AA39P3I6_9AGAR|nr:NADP-dependent oxidoreductase domain-containing protein [Armillaria luteobubalina]
MARTNSAVSTLVVCSLQVPLCMNSIVYQDGSSEEFIEEWAEHILGTTNAGDNSIAQKVNYIGNGSKSLFLSVEASRKKFRTDYIDILYVHLWDWETSVREVMDNLHYLVSLHKVLYLGISDTPAWVVAQANQYALDHGKTPFIVSFEREIIPMAREFGMALAPWDVLAAGRFRTDEEEKKCKEAGEKGRTLLPPDWERNEIEVGAVGNLTAAAIAYVMHKTPYVFPIVGGRKYLENVVPFDPCFSSSMIGDGTSHNRMLLAVAKIAKQPKVQPIFP